MKERTLADVLEIDKETTINIHMDIPLNDTLFKGRGFFEDIVSVVVMPDFTWDEFANAVCTKEKEFASECANTVDQEKEFLENISTRLRYADKTGSVSVDFNELCLHEFMTFAEELELERSLNC